MSPHAVNNFVSDLVLMAQAMERLPQVEHELNAANAEVHDWKTRYDSLAADLEQSRTYAASLEAKVRETEVAKDAAETMFLQADDRTMRAVEFIKAQFGAAGSLIQALEPERAKPPVEETVREETIPSWATPEVDNTGDYIPKVSEVKPIAADPIHDASGTVENQSTAHSGYVASLEPVASIDPPQGQSEADPTLASIMKAKTESPTASVNDTATPSDTASGEHSPGPYHDKTYFEATRGDDRYISYHDWITGGGSNENWSL